MDDVKDLVRPWARFVCERLGVTATWEGQEEPFWKRQIEKDIVKLLRINVKMAVREEKITWKRNIKLRLKGSRLSSRK